MTKKEQAFVDLLRVQAALSWPKFDKPSCVVAKDRETLPAWFGIAYIGSFSMSEPTLGTTSSTSHNRSGKGVGEQGLGDGYATKLDALKAMRWEAAYQCARKLADIDEMIEKEMTA